MPTKDRKYYILKHNNEVDEIQNKKDGTTISGEMINKFTDMSQLSQQNLKKQG